MDVKSEMRALLSSDLDFVVYRLPNARVSAIFYTQTAHTIPSDELGLHEGFLIAPFQHNNEYTLLPFSRDPALLNSNGFEFQKAISSTKKTTYIPIAEHFIESMQSKKLDKVILSRIEQKKIPANTDWTKIYLELTKAYPSAFVYCFRTKQHGLWMGATPEQFLKVENQHLQTVALAGTQPNSDNIQWSQKEKEEQQFVTDYIHELYRKNNLTVEMKGPETAAAGPVAHLKTYFNSTEAANPVILAKFAEELHPTPAVCGLPKEKALELILENEPHKRSCYCGFLGPIHRTDLNLFVNLRCMQIFKEQLALYVGGGLTKDSVPEQEWQETVEKAKTLLAIIEPSQKTN